MKTRPTIPQTDVLKWLAENHPELHAKAEIDRAWCWLPVDLRGDHNKPVRESLKQFGFRWAKHGHPLPSGRIGTWGHAAEKPIPFKRKGSRNGASGSKGNEKQGSADSASHPLDARLASDIDRALRDLGIVT